MVAESLAHVDRVFVPLPPFIVFTVVSILQRQGPPRRLGIQLGLLVTAQYLISPEVSRLLSSSSLSLLHASPSAIRRACGKCRASAANRSGSGGGAARLSLLVYDRWASAFHGTPITHSEPDHNDFLSFVVPGPLQKISLGMRSLGSRLAPSNGWTRPEVTSVSRS